MARIRKKLEQFQQFLQRNSELLSLPQRVHRHLWTRPDFLGAVFACGYSGVRVAAFFFLKNWHISSHLLLKSVSFLQRCLSLKRKREWYSIFYVLWMRGRMYQVVVKSTERPHHKLHRTKKPTQFHPTLPTVHKTLQSQISFSKTSLQ